MKYILCIIFVSTYLFSNAQNEVAVFLVASPRGIITQAVGNTQMQVEYERPLARKRQIFGELVPWNQLWRTGAGASTKIKINRAVTIEDQRLPAGTYSIFTIPNPDKWVVIINSDTTLYGTYGYNSSKDVARFVVSPKITDRYYEALTIDVDLVQSNARIYIAWTNIQVGFNMVTTTATEAMKYIDENLSTGLSKNSDAYYEAAQFLLFERTHLMQALKLTDHAIALNKENGAARRVKIETYEYLGLYKEALLEINHAIEMEKNKKYEKETGRMSEIKYWQNFQKRIKEQQEKN